MLCVNNCISVVVSGLPDENGRSQILRIHTARMKEHGKLASDVDISELAASTKNFSGAEIEGLVRAATSTAMNQLVKVRPKRWQFTYYKLHCGCICSGVAVNMEVNMHIL